ncbi:Enzymatic Polyprotein, partial [Phytophthora megakarya]
MVRMPGPSGNSGFHRESQEDVQVKIEQGNEMSSDPVSTTTSLNAGSADRQSARRNSVDGNEDDLDPDPDLEEKSHCGGAGLAKFLRMLDAACHCAQDTDYSSKWAVGVCLMQTMDGRDRVVAYASKLLVGSEKNSIHKVDGTSEIECWGIVWAKRKFRQEFNVYTDHKAFTWVFNENNRTSNSKLARWAMELSQLRFKMFHKAGTLMDHVDGLSRLHYSTIATLNMTDLLHGPDIDEVDHVLSNDLNPDDDGQVQVRESPFLMRDLLNDADLDDDNSVQVRKSGTLVDGDSEMIPAPGLLEVREHESVVGLPDSVSLSEHGAPHHPAAPSVRVSEEVVEPLVSSPVDEFGLDTLRFVEEQKRTLWIQALIAFLED